MVVRQKSCIYLMICLRKLLFYFTIFWWKSFILQLYGKNCCFILWWFEKNQCFRDRLRLTSWAFDKNHCFHDLSTKIADTRQGIHTGMYHLAEMWHSCMYIINMKNLHIKSNTTYIFFKSVIIYTRFRTKIFSRCNFFWLMVCNNWRWFYTWKKI